MTDFFETTIKNYSGLSSETKPTIAAGNTVPNGSRWREVDTGNTYFFNLVDDAWYEFNVAYKYDESTGALTIVSNAHQEIHEGRHFYLQGFLELDNTDEFFIKMVTPDTLRWSHFIFAIKSSGICKTHLDEDATGGMTGGSPVLALNNNRNSGNASGMIFTSGVTVATSYTTRLENDKWGAAGFKETIGGGGGREDEIILKQNTTYLRSFISGADVNIIQFKASWYEHINI